MSNDISLTPTSYIVLGFIDQAGELTPYGLKQLLETTVGTFWSVPHSQVYAEPARLAGVGYLTERQESAGRRRKRYALTDRGREALARWRDEPAAGMPELRDLSLLKLYFGGEPARIASARIAAHREKLKAYEALLESDDGTGPRGPWLALRSGIGHEREWVRFWSELAEHQT